MRPVRHPMHTLVVVVCLATTGCATMHPLPRAEYAALAARKGVKVELRDGRSYSFDFARFSPDTMIGHHMIEGGTAFEEYRTVAIPLETVEKLMVRRTSWLRTGLIAGGVAAIAVTAVAAGRSSTSTPADEGPTLPGPIDP